MSIAEILNQGVEHQRKGRYREALQAYNTVLAHHPNHADALNLSGIIASHAGDHARSLYLIKRALAQDPRNSGYLNSLGNALLRKGDRQAALEAFLKGLELAPDDPDLRYNTARAYNQLANARREQGLYEDALEFFRKALEFEPGSPQIHSNQGVALLEIGRASEAVALFETARKLDPGNTGAIRNLGNAYLAQGRVNEALHCYREALGQTPGDFRTHSNLLCCLNNVPEYNQAQLAAETNKWWQGYAGKFQINDCFSNPLDPQRRLKVGYVSPDFRQHSVSHFFRPLLEAHNRDAVDVFCYADVGRPDRTTRELQALSGHWRDIAGLSDQDVYERIVKDEIDILVDLAGHTAGNRLTVFARQPAPVQVTWLGYPNTTGLPAMHYRLTDAVADPPGESDRYHSEELIRLPRGFLCYHPPHDCPDVADTPALLNGHITFGSFNNIAKISPDVIRVWSGILQRVPNSTLLLKNKQFADNALRSRYYRLFAGEGISKRQLELLPYAPSKRDHMAIYNRVDIALDTFPYNGTTTTCEALWMGVPVVTLCGQRHASRVGASLMRHGDLAELITTSEAAYLEKAAALASDLDALDDLRQSIRTRLRASDLCSAAGFAGDMELVFRTLWLRWCEQEALNRNHANFHGSRSYRPQATATRQAEYSRGVELLAAGDLPGAEKVFERLIGRDPRHINAHYNLGVIRQRGGRLAEAVAAYQSVLRLDLRNADAYYNLGNCHLALDQPEEALRQYGQALHINPALAPAYNNMGLVLKNMGRLEEAIRSFKKAIAIEPGTAGFHQSLGLAYHRQARVWKAIDSFRTALKLQPDTPIFLFNLAAGLEDAGELEQAARHLTRAVRKDAGFHEAFHNLGDVLGKMGRFVESAEAYRQAVASKPDRPESWNGLGNALANRGSHEEAVDCYHRAIALRPDYAGAHLNLGTCYYQDRQLDQAEKQYRRALNIDAGLAEAEFNLGLVHLLRGDLQKGWPGYEWRLDKSDWPASYPFRLDRPMWKGRPFKGQTLLVHDEQGLGDTLQFARYLEMVKPLGGEVVLETRPPLVELLKETRGADRVIERSRDGKPSVDFDLYCPLLSLPHIFSTALDTIPARVPYIHPDIEKADHWAARVDSAACNVGLVWSGNPTHFRGRNRSAALADFGGLLQTSGVRFYGFQTGAAAREAEAFTAAGLLENLGAELADFSDTAAAMAHMDLVISIDTSVAHLAGAMGKPVWLLLAYAADWRWFLERSDSPWYPTMRLFRQIQPGDWTGVIAAVKGALKEMVAKVE